MARKIFLLGMLAMALAFGITVVGCGDDTIGNGGGNVGTQYRGTYRYYTYSGTTSLTTTEYTYIVSATKVEYTISSNGNITTNTIYDEAWTEGRDLWVKGANTRSLIGTFDADGNTLTTGSMVYTKGNTGSYSLEGTWYFGVQKYNFSHGDFELYYNDSPYKKGTYYTSNDTMTMTITHLGRYGLSSYATYLDSSKKWYTKNELKTTYLNYYRDSYRAQLQQTYNAYVSSYGYATANSLFQSAYGSSDIDTIADSYVQSRYGNSIDTSLNSLYANATSTVAYALREKLFLGGITYTKE